MDVHVRNSFLHVADDAGKVMRRGRCRNTITDLAEFLGSIEREARRLGEPVRAVLESTTSSRAIRRMLMQYGEAAEIDLTANVLDARKSGSSRKASAGVTALTRRCSAIGRVRT